MKKTLLNGIGTMALVAGSLAFSAPAQATQTKCTNYANTHYATDLVSAVYTATPARCVITNQTAFGAAVASGSINWSEPETRVVDTYDSTPEFEVGALISSVEGAPVYGDWIQIGSDLVTVSSPQKVGKSTNTKTTTTTASTFERTITTTVTRTYEAYEVVVTLQDIETFREGSQATVKTAVRTVRTFGYNNGGNVQNVITTVTTEPTQAGDPLAHEEVQGLEEGAVVAGSEVSTPVIATEDNGGVVVTEMTTTEQNVVTTVEACVDNKSKSKNRGAC